MAGDLCEGVGPILEVHVVVKMLPSKQAARNISAEISPYVCMCPCMYVFGQCSPKINGLVAACGF